MKISHKKTKKDARGLLLAAAPEQKRGQNILCQRNYAPIKDVAGASRVRPQHAPAGGDGCIQ